MLRNEGEFLVLSMYAALMAHMDSSAKDANASNPLSSDMDRAHTGRERIPVSVHPTSSAASRAVAAEIAALLRERASQGRMAVLGLATGSTPQGVYDELVRMHREDGLSFRNAITFNLDEYWPM